MTRPGTVSVAFVLLASALAQEPNPVTNGGFEDWRGPNLPTDWSTLGKVSRSPDTHSGQAAVLMETQSVDAETGLNRDWAPHSGKQGTMLSQRRGGIRFWYKVPQASADARLHFFVIPMSRKPIEDTGSARADFAVPATQFGDGRWHLGVLAYDFTDNPEAAWVHLSPRIFGTNASLLLDDIEYIEQVGPLLSVVGMRWEEDAQRPGEAAVLAVRVKNCGDQPTAAATVRPELPTYLRLGPGVGGQVPELAPESVAELSFPIVGRRDRADTITVTVDMPGTKGEPATADYRLEPRMLVVQLRPQRFILAVGEETVVDAVVRGDGTAICTGLTGTLTVGPGLEVTAGPKASVEAAPGREACVSWRVKAVKQTPRCELSAALSSANSGQGTASSSVVIGGVPKAVPDQAGAGATTEVAWVQGHDIRLVSWRSEFGFGIADVQVRKAAWETVARLPSAGRVVVQTAAGRPQELPLYGEAGAKDGTLTITCRFTDADGAAWTAAVACALREDGRNLGFTSTVQCDRARQLLAVDGPMLYVGEGSFGAAKDEGLFPGLDWLDRNEESSNWQVIQRGHPHQVRYVPHPSMITIPLMSIHREGVTVGLLWDGKQKWDGQHDRPAAAFGSPDRFEGRNAHLLGLFLPSVGDKDKPWVKMNERTAAVPYPLAVNQTLTLAAILYARTGTADALTAMDEWFRIFGVPEPGPLPRGTPEAEVAFSMQAYLKSLWVPESQEWWTSRGAGKILSPKGRPASFVYDLLKGALVVQDPALAAACRARAQEVQALQPTATPAYTDCGFDYGGADQWVIGSVNEVPGLMLGQGTDGAWRFDAKDTPTAGVFQGMDYHRLGPDQAAEVGTCAARARTLLRAARVSGLTDAYEAGVKALRFMQALRVPRAAQVWEVMVQAPDILAAAEACEAYLEAYQYDRNPDWLVQARRWARGGLPFVYAWDDPQRPFLLGASIPVFGASWETCSWFGRPVQWNGLRHAQAMLQLARYDQSMPWEKLARAILVSALHQQSTKEDDVALWPDSIGAIDADKSGWIFAPLQVLGVLYDFMGRPQAPDTVILGRLPDRVHLTSGARISDATWEQQTLKTRLAYPAGESGYTVMVNLARPETVLLDGKVLPESAALKGGSEPGWQYLTGHALCLVRLTEAGEHAVEVRGAQFRRSDLMPALRTEIKFEFDQAPEGWLPAHAIAEMAVKDGCLQVPVTGNDPYLTRSGMQADGTRISTIVVRLRLPALDHPESGQWYWGTVEAPGFAEARVAHFEPKADGQWHEYRLPVGRDPGWRGHTITAIRLDPFQLGSGVTAEIDWIRGE